MNAGRLARDTGLLLSVGNNIHSLSLFFRLCVSSLQLLRVLPCGL